MVYLGLQEPGKPWTVKSRGLAEGLSLYEQSVNRFGIPLREATDPDMDGWYEVDDEDIDYAEAAFEEYSKATKNPEPGAMLRVVNTKVPDSDRPEGARRPSPRGEEGLGDVVDGLKMEPSL